MATYTTDLQTFNLIEAAITALEFTNYAAGRTQAYDTDYPIQGNGHASAILAVVGQGSIALDYGSNITWTSGWNIFLWGTFLAPAAIDTRANGGAVLIIGAGLGDYRGYYVGGNDFGSYPYGGWQNFVADPEVTPSITLGTPGTSYRYTGIGHKAIIAVAKGSPQGLDGVRFGRGELRVVGTDANFTGMSVANDLNTTRWGLFRAIPGGFEMKGLLVLGFGGAVTFSDSDKNIVIDNTLFVKSTFNGIELRTAASSLTWVNISITALGTVSKGYISMIDNCTFNDTGGIFTDMDTFIYQSGATITSRTFRRCGQVTQGSATIENCVFDKSTAAVALVVNNLSLVTKNEFISSGTGHAVNLGTVAASTSITWDNLDSGYAIQSGTAANRTILVNVASGQTLTINVADTGSSPSYYNTGTGTVSIVAGQKSFGFTVSPAITGYEWRIYSITASGSLAGAVELAGEETASSASQSYTYSYTSTTPIAVQILSNNYEESVTYYSLINGNQSVSIKLVTEGNV